MSYEIPIDGLRELLTYEPESGRLVWKRSHHPRVKAGQEAGHFHAESGYRKVKYNGRNYLAHRVAWAIHTGQQPNIIDHINGVKDDNRFCNLRSCSIRENNRNRISLPRNNTSGFRGVHLDKKTNKWIGQINLKERSVRVGSFDSPQMAGTAVQKARELLYGTTQP